MAHFAKLGINSKVIHVVVIDNNLILNADGIEDETNAIDILTREYGWPLWKKCSYNTREGKYWNADGTEHSDQSKAFRKNYPSIGYTYDEDRDAFIPPKPYSQWTLNETTCQWEAPVAEPDPALDEDKYTDEDSSTHTYGVQWNEDRNEFVGTKTNGDRFSWDPTAKTWTAI